MVTGRFSRPEEVADLVVLLASDQAANITGADIRIDGAWFLPGSGRSVAEGFGEGVVGLGQAGEFLGDLARRVSANHGIAAFPAAAMRGGSLVSNRRRVWCVYLCAVTSQGNRMLTRGVVACFVRRFRP
jgi:hypothetical protein